MRKMTKSNKLVVGGALVLAGLGAGAVDFTITGTQTGGGPGGGGNGGPPPSSSAR